MSAFSKPETRSKYEIGNQDPVEHHMVSYITGGLEVLFKQIKSHTVPVLHDYGYYTDEEGCFTLGDGQCILALRYRCVALLGTGQSSVVIKAQDTFCDNKEVGIKILHTGYYQLGAQESHCLLRLRAQDPFNYSHVVKLLNTFSYDDHFCMVFELLYQPNWTKVFFPDDKDGNPEVIYPKIRKLAARLLQVLGFLQQHNVIHADLKPENILLHSEAKLSSAKIVDFGNAIHCIHDEVSLYYDDFELQTLLYRAPEVMFGLPFGTEIDMWSLGCILAEMFMGRPLFFGTNKDEVLQKMLQLLGPIPRPPVKRGKFFSSLEMYTHCGKQPDATLAIRSVLETGRVKKCTNYAFANFLARLLRYDPGERLSPCDAARHPFLAPDRGVGYHLPPTGQSSNEERCYPTILVSKESYLHRPCVDQEILRQHPSSIDLLYMGTSCPKNNNEEGMKRRIAEVSPLRPETFLSTQKSQRPRVLSVKSEDGDRQFISTLGMNDFSEFQDAAVPTDSIPSGNQDGSPSRNKERPIEHRPEGRHSTFSQTSDSDSGVKLLDIKPCNIIVTEASQNPERSQNSSNTTIRSTASSSKLSSDSTQRDNKPRRRTCSSSSKIFTRTNETGTLTACNQDSQNVNYSKNVHSPDIKTCATAVALQDSLRVLPSVDNPGIDSIDLSATFPPKTGNSEITHRDSKQRRQKGSSKATTLTGRRKSNNVTISTDDILHSGMKNVKACDVNKSSVMGCSFQISKTSQLPDIHTITDSTHGVTHYSPESYPHSNNTTSKPKKKNGSSTKISSSKKDSTVTRLTESIPYKDSSKTFTNNQLETSVDSKYVEPPYQPFVTNVSAQTSKRPLSSNNLKITDQIVAKDFIATKETNDTRAGYSPRSTSSQSSRRNSKPTQQNYSTTSSSSSIKFNTDTGSTQDKDCAQSLTNDQLETSLKRTGGICTFNDVTLQFKQGSLSGSRKRDLSPRSKSAPEVPEKSPKTLFSPRDQNFLPHVSRRQDSLSNKERLSLVPSLDCGQQLDSVVALSPKTVEKCRAVLASHVDTTACNEWIKPENGKTVEGVKRGTHRIEALPLACTEEKPAKRKKKSDKLLVFRKKSGKQKNNNAVGQSAKAGRQLPEPITAACHTHSTGEEWQMEIHKQMEMPKNIATTYPVLRSKRKMTFTVHGARAPVTNSHVRQKHPHEVVADALSRTSDEDATGGELTTLILSDSEMSGLQREQSDEEVLLLTI